jgi:DNA-binding MltR family transcriptional regulator
MKKTYTLKAEKGQFLLTGQDAKLTKYRRVADSWFVKDQKASFVLEIDRSSDRAAAIMAGAFLEEQLRDAIERLLLNDKEARKRFTKHSGPLGSFAAKINLVYLLGLYSKTVQDDLIVVSDIRNLFAHETTAINFDSREMPFA